MIWKSCLIPGALVISLLTPRSSLLEFHCKVTKSESPLIELYRVISSFIELLAPKPAKIWFSAKNLVILHLKSNMFNPLNSFLCTTTITIFMPPVSTVPLWPSVTSPTFCPSRPGPSSADGCRPTPACRSFSPLNPALSRPRRSLLSTAN